jgi:hypothetical protein
MNVDGERVCADAEEVNEVQYLLQVQDGDVEYFFDLRAGGEWPPRWTCNDEAGLGARAVKRVRWPPAASKRKTLAAARQVA